MHIVYAVQEFFKELFTIESTYDVLEIVFTALLFVLVIVISILTCKYISDYSIINSMVDKGAGRLSENERKRRSKHRVARVIHGELPDEKDLLSRLDKLLSYSGLKYKFPTLSADVLLTAAIAMNIVTPLATLLIMESYIYGLIVAVVLAVGGYVYLLVLCNRMYHKVHNSAMKFMNTIESFASTSNDIIEILERSVIYLDDPLKTHVYACVMDARANGNIDYSLRTLRMNVENEYFKEIIRNLYMCALHEANYAEVIRESKFALQQSLKSEEERLAIRKNGRNDMFTLLVLGFVCVEMAARAAGTNSLLLFTASGIVGNILGIYLLICILAVFYVGFLMGMRKTD